MNMTTNIKMTVVGSGAVGLSLAVLFAQYNEVVVLDVDSERVAEINDNRLSVLLNGADQLTLKRPLSLTATLDKGLAYKDSRFIIIATPTNTDPITNSLNTKVVDTVVEEALQHNKNGLIIIKSTIPVGHTEKLQKKLKTNRIIFSPEFLRDSHELNDNVYPSRIIIGNEHILSKEFSILLKQLVKQDNVNVLFTRSIEAEAIKLFSNSYLAMRVAFFNELDTFSIKNDLDIKKIINGISLDGRIGMGYNNPSFGYGGYCLPKDTRQLKVDFNETPVPLISSIIESNSSRKDFIANYIMKKKPKTIGFYGLEMKKDSNDIRASAILGIINRLKKSGMKIILYDTKITLKTFNGFDIMSDLDEFIELSSLIVVNRMPEVLMHVKSKVFTRDAYRTDV